MQLSKSVKVIRAANAAAVGTANVTGSVIDMSDYDGVMLVAHFGAVTDGTPTLKAQGGAQSNGSDAADLAGTGSGPAASNNVLVLDLFRPTQRYITPVVVRGGATGCVLNSIVAIQYSARNKPTINDATTVSDTHSLVSPALGTP